MAMPPLYKCEVCELQIDPKNSTTLRYISGWARGTTTNLKHMDKNHFRYVHEYCFGIKEHNETLF
jgi:hypothetical protein